MPAAVFNYAHYLADPYPWMLGRFIVPASRLDEFETALRDSEWAGSGSTWRLSLLSDAASADIGRVDDFNRRHQAPGGCEARIDSIEVRTRTEREIEAASRAVARRFDLFCEIPIAGEVATLLAALRREGAHAKIRCGGAAADGFPATAHLAGFLQACSCAGVGFKATAGLHHALRGEYRLNYDPGSPSAVMHGFLNLFLAAAWTRSGVTAEVTAGILEERAATAFSFSDGSIGWRGRKIGAAEIAAARRGFALAFGSCSFAEPAAELKGLGLV
jgi:hypothetical protein